MNIVELSKKYDLKAFNLLELVKKLKIRATNVLSELSKSETTKLDNYLTMNSEYPKKKSEILKHPFGQNFLVENRLNFNIEDGLVQAFKEDEWKRFTKFIKTDLKELMKGLDKLQAIQAKREIEDKQEKTESYKIKLSCSHRDSEVIAISKNNKIIGQNAVFDNDLIDLTIDAKTGAILNWSQAKKEILKLINDNTPKDRKIT